MLPDYQLLEAAKHNDMQAAREAVDRGANVHARDLDGHSALFLACTQGHMQLAEFLVDRGADVDEIFGKRRQTMLHWAAERGSFGLTKFLVARKADVNALRCDNATPLDLATRGDHEYVARLLRDRNAVAGPKKSIRRATRTLTSKANDSDVPTSHVSSELERRVSVVAAESDRSGRGRHDDSPF